MSGTWLSIMISNQQFVDMSPLSGNETNAEGNSHPPDLIISIKIIEEGVLRIFLPQIGIREHSWYAHRTELLAKSGQSHLPRIVEPGGRIKRTGI